MHDFRFILCLIGNFGRKIIKTMTIRIEIYLEIYYVSEKYNLIRGKKGNINGVINKCVLNGHEWRQSYNELKKKEKMRSNVR